jgi:hypothetical protein
VAGWPGTDRSKAKWFEISGLVASPGHTVRAQVLNAGRSLSIHNDGPSARFALAVHSGLDADPVAVRPNIQIPAGKAWRFETADWSGQDTGHPIDILEADWIVGRTVLRQFRIPVPVRNSRFAPHRRRRSGAPMSDAFARPMT